MPSSPTTTGSSGPRLRSAYPRSHPGTEATRVRIRTGAAQPAITRRCRNVSGLAYVPRRGTVKASPSPQRNSMARRTMPRPAPRSGGSPPDRGRSAKFKRRRLLCSSVRMPCLSSCTACVRLVSGPGWGDASWDHADRVLAYDPVADGGGGATGASGSSSSTTTQASRVRSLSPNNLATTRARITSRPCGRGRCRTRSPVRKNPVAGSGSSAGSAGNSISRFDLDT